MALWGLDWLETLEILDVEDYNTDDLLDIAPLLTGTERVCDNHPKSGEQAR